MRKKEIKQEEIKWCPTQGGSIQGYMPEYFDKKEGIWKLIPSSSVPHPNSKSYQIEAPPPMFFGNVLSILHLCGYSQAMALAWHFACINDAHGTNLQVRIQEYEVVYDVKARRV